LGSHVGLPDKDNNRSALLPVAAWVGGEDSPPSSDFYLVRSGTAWLGEVGQGAVRCGKVGN